MEFNETLNLVRDQGVGGSNLFSPTNLLISSYNPTAYAFGVPTLAKGRKDGAASFVEMRGTGNLRVGQPPNNNSPIGVCRSDAWRLGFQLLRPYWRWV